MRLPGPSHRIAIIGRTGSGKTQAAAWFLAQAVNQSITVNGTRRDVPWIILDYKRDKLLNTIKAQEMAVTASIPSKGLHIVHPLPQSDDEAVTALLWRIWQKGGTGLYIDEGYMIGDSNPAFRALLTQGRSKNIPIICLSQRPVYMDRFAFSEADFYLVFNLTDRKDQQRVGEFLHKNIDLREDVAKYHAWYHDVGAHEYTLLQPVPSSNKIKQLFKTKFGRRKALI